jgi:hypothetical protein
MLELKIAFHELNWITLTVNFENQRAKLNYVWLSCCLTENNKAHTSWYEADSSRLRVWKISSKPCSTVQCRFHRHFLKIYEMYAQPTNFGAFIHFQLSLKQLDLWKTYRPVEPLIWVNLPSSFTSKQFRCDRHWTVRLKMTAETPEHFHVKFPSCLSEYNQNWNVSTN